MKTIGIISANYISGDFGELAKRRTLASLPVGGRYRLIDFALSNMENSGITTVGVVAPYNSGSLIDHIGVGKPWSMDRKEGGMFVMPGSVFGTTRTGSRFIMKDLIANRQFVEKDDADYVLVSGSSDVYSMDYRDLIEFHSHRNVPVTIVVKNIPDGEKRRGFFVETDHRGNVVKLLDSAEGEAKYFMDCFIVNRNYLEKFIKWYEPLEHMDFMEILAENLNQIDISVYEFEGYLGKVSNLEDYKNVNNDLIKQDVVEALFTEERPIHTKVQDEAPTAFMPGSNIKNSLIAAGCKIEGTVENSVVFRSTNICKGAVIKNSVILQHGEIGENAVLENVILDKYVTIGSGIKIIGDTTPIVIGKGKKI